ncbi:fucose permease [Pseudomonas duriflava]|uniref:Fucose permease n=1 Tax=Pseudomonas duriflava TaxID=459528 RepID=A0A562QLN1_9PSED|nr:MFS transporter [Pseudomonas duriflava]TWI57634.1 fucose permease [Pseudomonas duriflava]
MSTTESPSLWQARMGVVAIFFANGFGVGAWAVSIPGIKTALGLTAGQLSIALLSVAVGAVLLMPLVGPLVPRFGGTGRMTRYASIVAALILFLPGWAPSLPWLIAAAFLFGASNGLIDVAMNAHASVIEKRWGTPIMSSFHAAFSGGGLVGAALGGLLLHLGVSTPWLLTATALLVLLVMLAASVRIGDGEAGSAGDHAFRLPDRRVLAFCVIALFCLMIEGAMADWSAVYLNIEIKASNGLAAAGYAAFSLTMLIGRLLGDRLIHALGGPRIILFGALMAAIGLLLAIAVPSPWVVIVGFALVGLGLANVIPAVFSASGQMTASPAVGISMAATTGYLGFLIGPPLIGFVASLYGLKTGIGLLAGSALLVTVLATLQRRIGVA